MQTLTGQAKRQWQKPTYLQKLYNILTYQKYAQKAGQHSACIGYQRRDTRQNRAARPRLRVPNVMIDGSSLSPAAPATKTLCIITISCLMRIIFRHGFHHVPQVR